MENLLAKQFKEHNKELGRKSTLQQVIGLFVSIFIKIPIIFILIVVSLVLNILKKLVTLVPSSSGEQDESSSGSSRTLDLPMIPESEIIPYADRKYDVVMYGITGFTGKLAGKYLAKQYGTSITWAMAGRSMKKLEAIRSEIVNSYPELEGKIDCIEADSFRLASLPDLVKNTRVVCTTVGPFAKYGVPIVEHCAMYGTCYTDITGEGQFVRDNVAHLSERAKLTGSRIVSFCGHDCVPWDILTLAVTKALKDGNSVQDLKSISMYDEAWSTASGGTIATVIDGIHGGAGKSSLDKSHQLKFDPMVRKLDGSKATNKLNVNLQKFPAYSSQRSKYTGFFLMSGVNATCVRRSNAILHYGDNPTYYEALVYSNLMEAINANVDLALAGTLLSSAWLCSLALKLGILPSPGEGPSEYVQENGFLRVVAYGVGTLGDEVTASLFYAKDPGYRDTARMLIESGLALALDYKKIFPQVPGGVYTPASGIGMPLLDRLCKTGCEYTVFKNTGQPKMEIENTKGY